NAGVAVRVGEQHVRRRRHREVGTGIGLPRTKIEVLALEAPVRREGVFDARAERVSGLGVAAVDDQDARATAGSAGADATVVETGGVTDKGDAALGVEQRAIPGVTDAAGDDAVSVADPGGVDAV